MIAPLKGRITSPFGYRVHPITKQRSSFHNGIDIAAPVGTPIVAPANGKVSEAWDHERGGICLAMITTDGIRFGFAHLNKRLKKVGDVVKIGEPIAECGNTGASTGPHLHFTMKKGREWLNPTVYIDFETSV